jgi:hypothetical protein
MVAVGVGDDGAWDGVPGGDVEVAEGAVEAVVGEMEEGVWHAGMMIE